MCIAKAKNLGTESTNHYEKSKIIMSSEITIKNKTTNIVPTLFQHISEFTIYTVLYINISASPYRGRRI